MAYQSWAKTRADMIRGLVNGYIEHSRKDPARATLYRTEAHKSALELVKKSWDRETGDAWQRLEEAERAVDRARGAGDKGLDFARLAYEVDRVGKMYGRWRNMNDARAFYNNASAVEKRAMQDTAPALLPGRFPGESAGAFLRKLEQDREAASSPDLPKAQAAKDEAVGELYDLYEAAQSASRMLEAGAARLEIGRVLRGVRMNKSAVASGPNAGIYVSIERAQPDMAPESETFEPTGERANT